MTETTLAEVKVDVPDNALMVALLGQNDELLRIVEAEFDADIFVRGNEINVRARPAEAEAVQALYEELVLLAEQGHLLDREVLQRTIGMVRRGEVPSDVLTHNVISTPARIVRPKSVGQKRYVEAIERNAITFGIGPAGTGKTYLAMAAAVGALQDRVVQRIILTRPAVEAGEKLGFLPGDLLAKVDPYLRPLYDSLYDILGPEATGRLTERGAVEVAPLAYMRGRTINDSFVVLDEAQNTSPEQMKMFLTRIGFGSKAVVTGDVTQIDLPGTDRSGLTTIPPEIFELDGVARVELGSEDVVRHPIVAKIIDAYEQAESAGESGGTDGDRGTRRKRVTAPRSTPRSAPRGAQRGSTRRGKGS